MRPSPTFLLLTALFCERYFDLLFGRIMHPIFDRGGILKILFFLFNGLAFVWDDDARASSMTSQIGRSLLDARRWRRLLTGRIDARALARSIGRSVLPPPPSSGGADARPKLDRDASLGGGGTVHPQFLRRASRLAFHGTLLSSLILFALSILEAAPSSLLESGAGRSRLKRFGLDLLVDEDFRVWLIGRPKI